VLVDGRRVDAANGAALDAEVYQRDAQTVRADVAAATGGNPVATGRRYLAVQWLGEILCRSEHMAQDKLLARICADPAIFGGKPIIRGMRISVEHILSLLAQGQTETQVLADYPGLEPADLQACLAYAHAVVARDSLDAVRIQ
jgi:uncharacterized protein (DUF433 family)